MAPLDRRQFCRALGAAAVGGLAGCLDEDASARPDDGAIDGGLDSAPRDDWPMHGYDAANTGHHPDATGPEAPVAAHVLASPGRTPPAVLDGTVFASGSDGQLVAVDPTDGQIEWQYEVSAEHTDSTAAIAGIDGTVFVSDNRGMLAAVDARDGSEQWTYSLDGPGARPPAVVGRTLYAAATRGPLVALDVDTGDERWRFDGPADEAAVDVAAGPAVVDDALYVGGANGTMYGVDAADGTVRWQTDVGSDAVVSTPPTVSDGTVYVCTRHGSPVAIDATSGERLWTSELSSSGVSHFAVAEDGLFVTDHSRLAALDPATGEEQWQGTSGDWAYSAPVHADGTVYHGSSVTGLFAHDAETGALEWTYETDSTSELSPAAPIVVDDVVFFADNSGLYALTSDED